MGQREMQDTRDWRLRGGGTTQDTGLAEASGQMGAKDMHKSVGDTWNLRCKQL